jgi:hypothetical protein
VPYELYTAGRYPDASIAIYDVNSLMTSIYNEPQNYLNGSAPLNVTGFYHQCPIGGQCYTMPGTLDSYMW